MNDYGMPFSELLEKLDNFLGTPEYNDLIDTVCEEIVDRANMNELFNYDFFMIKDNEIEELILSKNIDKDFEIKKFLIKKINKNALVGLLKYNDNLIFYSLKIFKYKDYVFSFDFAGRLFIDTFKNSSGSLENYIKKQNSVRNRYNVLFDNNLEQTICEINKHCEKFDDYDELFNYSIFSKNQKAYVLNREKIVELVKNRYFQ